MAEAPRRLSPTERERRLLRASRRYMDGRISQDALRALERRYRTDYAAAAAALARLLPPRRVRRSRWPLVPSPPPALSESGY